MAGLKVRDLVSLRVDGMDRERLQRSIDSARTVVAREHDEAATVAERLDEVDGELVVVVDDDGQARGAFHTEEIRFELDQRIGGPRAGAREGVDDPDLPLGLPRDEDEMLESVRSVRPRLHWCSIGQHFVSKRPCRDHGD